jgi:hypothetical protein
MIRAVVDHTEDLADGLFVEAVDVPLAALEEEILD